MTDIEDEMYRKAIEDIDTQGIQHNHEENETDLDNLMGMGYKELSEDKPKGFFNLKKNDNNKEKSEIELKE
jgi:hypothetical protein